MGKAPDDDNDDADDDYDAKKGTRGPASPED